MNKFINLIDKDDSEVTLKGVQLSLQASLQDLANIEVNNSIESCKRAKKALKQCEDDVRRLRRRVMEHHEKILISRGRSRKKEFINPNTNKQ